MTIESFDKSNLLPLCVDLDGTLIANDVTWLSVKLYLKEKPSAVFKILMWLFLGRAYLKHQLARHVHIDPASLPYNISVLNYIKSQKGLREIYLVTAADIKFALTVSDFLGLFTDVMASNGHTNLRAQNKANALNIRFGQENYIYIGNSNDDMWIWRHSAEVWICTSDENLIKEVKKLNKPIKYFE